MTVTRANVRASRGHAIALSPVNRRDPFWINAGIYERGGYTPYLCVAVNTAMTFSGFTLGW